MCWFMGVEIGISDIMKSRYIPYFITLKFQSRILSLKFIMFAIFIDDRPKSESEYFLC